MFTKLFVVVTHQSLDNWSFDIFAVNDLGEGHTLKYIGYELMQKFDLIYKFKVRRLALSYITALMYCVCFTAVT